LAQQVLPVGSEFNQHFTPVLFAVPAPYGSVFDEAID
jgi:hypothetical protein